MTRAERHLEDGLVLHWSTAADVERIVECVGTAFGGKDGPDEPVQGLARRFTRGDYPFMGPHDFAYVEDSRRSGNPVVACACYLREEWELDGITLPVARPEIVGTVPEYRRRGLIRRIFDELHDRAVAENTLVQGITGKSYFYRQFGYEYALDLGGNITVPVALLPSLPAGEKEPYRLRRATEDDVPAIAECYRQSHESSLVRLNMPVEYWRYHLAAESETNPIHGHHRIRVLEDDTGRFCGFVLLWYDRARDSYGFQFAGFSPGSNLQRIAPSLLREIRREGAAVPARKPDQPLRTLVLAIGPDHLLERALPAECRPRVNRPYAWYLRIPDIPAFLLRIAPALERRLSASPFAGYSGELLIDLYRSGVRLGFEDGRLTTAEECDGDQESARARFPPLVVNTLLVGYRSLDELRANYPDAWAHDEVAGMIDTLFPKRPSHLFDA